jgi:RpiB/LacA/LacB family sugar-phosphate isomerase
MNINPAGKIYVGSDESSYELKSDLKPYLEELGFLVVDLGAFDIVEPSDYTVIAREVAEKVVENEDACDDIDDKDSMRHGCEAYGLLLNANGEGMLTAVNAMKGVEAALCTTSDLAKEAKAKGLRIICLATEATDLETAKVIISAFLTD